ncbi:MAG: hypothetical protein ACRDLY_00325 [Thermoleophilaceae bacterium]
MRERPRLLRLPGPVLDDPECFLRVKAPNRSFPEVVQVEVFLDAARLLDGDHREFSWPELCAIRSSAGWLAQTTSTWLHAP